MTRAIIVPPLPAPEALGELKQWLALTGSREDAMLERLIKTALELCEGFTGQFPLEATCEETLGVSSAWQPLATRPVHAIVAAYGIPAEGARFALAADAYAIDLDADGSARVRVSNPGSAGRIAVRFVAGLAPTWRALPEGLRHGVIRLAAHQHRARETGATDPLPAGRGYRAVAAVAADADRMTDIDTLVARLVVKARKLGLARAEALLLERGGKPALRWRQPRLLWPLIGQTLGSE